MKGFHKKEGETRELLAKGLFQAGTGSYWGEENGTVLIIQTSLSAYAEIW